MNSPSHGYKSLSNKDNSIRIPFSRIFVGRIFLSKLSIRRQHENYARNLIRFLIKRSKSYGFRLSVRGNLCDYLTRFTTAIGFYTTILWFEATFLSSQVNVRIRWQIISYLARLASSSRWKWEERREKNLMLLHRDFLLSFFMTKIIFVLHTDIYLQSAWHICFASTMAYDSRSNDYICFDYLK